MGPKRPPFWRRPIGIALSMAGVIAIGMALGLGLGHRLTPPPPPPMATPAPVATPAAPAGPAEGEDTDEAGSPLIQPPPPRPDPGSSEALDFGTPAESTPPRPAPPPPPPPRLPPAGAAQWQRNAQPAPAIAGRPMIAVIIDDVGVDRRRADRVAALPGPLTLSFMSYAEDLSRLTREARRHGHELMVHVPMQPRAASIDPGPGVLDVGMPAEEIRRRLDWALGRFDGYIGINNHMGSLFTADTAGMRVVMDELRRRGLVFVDSVTTDHSIAADTARQYGVPVAVRHVFLDNDQGVAHVRAQLAKTEAHARRHGFAIAIGHPHDGTIEALAGWVPGIETRGLILVPVSTIIRTGATG